MEEVRYRLRQLIRKLEKIRGRHTELVSVYIPTGYNLNLIINHLSEEAGTASNIKSKSVRTNVTTAIERMITELRKYKKTPNNGLVVFSGNISDVEGKPDYEVWAIEPPEEVNIRLYRCDQTFVLDPLKEQLEAKSTYGLLVMELKDAMIGTLHGRNTKKIKEIQSQVMGKFKAGGQCLISNTFIQSTDGEIIKIKKLHNPYILKSANFSRFSIKDSPVIDKWKVGKKEVYKIITKNPRLVVESSKDHVYFVSTQKGIKEKTAGELKEGDLLLMPEKLDIKSSVQKLNSKQYYNSFTINKAGGELLKKKRKEIVLIQRELAKKIGVMQATISSYELGKLNAHRGTLKRLCDYLGIDFYKFLDKYTKPYKYREINLPKEITPKFAQFIGYYIGDGSIEKDRITFFEQRKEVAMKYKNTFEKYFGANISYRFRESKNYYQLRFNSRPLVRLIKKEFPEIKRSLDTEIPKKIMQASKEVIAKFIKGYFDAEGWVTLNRGCVGVGANNRKLIIQMLMLLLRFSILSSFIEYDNKGNPYSNNPLYQLQINDKKSLSNFQKLIGFTSTEKRKKLDRAINKKSSRGYTRQIITPGSQIRGMVEKAGHNMSLFPKVTNFFRNERMMSKTTFKNSILAYVKDKKLYKKLKSIHDFPIIPVKINKIEKSTKKVPMIDISVKNENFIANGIIVHNSAARFSRIREGQIKDFMKKLSDLVNDAFLGKDIAGLLIGGPGPAKESFVKNYLNKDLRKKVLTIQDIGYTGEQGLKELITLSKEVLGKERIMFEKKWMDRFLLHMAKEDGLAAYGEKEVFEALSLGAIDKLLLSEGLEEERVERFIQKSQEFGTDIIFISESFQEGRQLKELGGFAAILRFKTR